ncbi:MAG: hypothetical protein A2Y38_20725 [Spirochaetes bacterium GWB1_59_5]|nr:MAG: hypothetical protein A2Y38_20725 [Spirochaetes bacterium GWB1_59_5]
MGSDFSIIGRIKLAFEVMSHWETLVTLGAFIVLWLLMSYVADPWRNSGRAPRSRSAKPVRKVAPKAPVEELDEEDELPR